MLNSFRFKHLSAVVISIAMLAFSYAYLRHYVDNSQYLDFDEYYFGGLAERHGSYTNLTSIFHAAILQHRYVLVGASGVFGAPALIAFVFMPLSFFPVQIAEHVWDVAMALLTLFAIRSAGGREWPFYLMLQLVTFSMLSAMEYGNASVLTFCLIAFAYGQLKKCHTQRAAILLGIAAAFKAYPIVLVAVFAVKRDWKSVGVTICTTSVLTLACLPIFGANDFVSAIHRLVSVGSTKEIWQDNDSLPGAFLYITRSFVISRVSEVIAIAGYFMLINKWRSMSIGNLFVLANGLMLLAQSITWGHYYSVVILIVIATMTATRSNIVRIWTIFVFLLNGLPAFTWRVDVVPPGALKMFSLMMLVVGLVLIEHKQEALNTESQMNEVSANSV